MSASRSSRTSHSQAAPVRALSHRAAVVAAVAMVFSLSAQAQSADTAAAAPQESTLPAVKVQASKESLPGDFAPTFAGGQVARGADFGVLGQQNMLDVPFSMTTYTSKLIEDQQARTIADVLANDPSVRTAYAFGNFAETYVIRGFELQGDDVSLNGLYGITPRQLVATDALERVDVFKGANAFLNGASPNGSAVGGGINLQLKRADDKPLTRVTLDGTASGEIGAHVDIGRRFGSEGQFGIRVNQANHDGETSIDGEHRRDNTTAVSLDWRGDKLRLYGDFLYQRQRINSGRPTVNDFANFIPGPPAATYNYAQTWSFSSIEDTVGILRAEYDFLPGWTAYVTGGMRHTDEQGEYSSPSVQANGTTTATRLGVPHKEDGSSAEAGVRGHFNTGPVSHFVTAGASIVRVDSMSAFTFSSAFPTSLYDTPQVPYPPTTLSGGNLADPQTTALNLMRSIAVSDTLGFLNDRVLFTIGARHQELLSNTYAYTGTQTRNYNDSITTPVFGLVVRPMEHVALFANHSEALTIGDAAPNTAANFGDQLPPAKSKQWEVGAKYDNGQYGASFAAFQIERPLTFVNSSNVFVADGTQKHRGLEASIYGEPLKGVRLIAGATYLHATQEGTASGATDGNKPIGVPTMLFNVNAEYDVPVLSGLTLTARWIHTGSQYLNVTNTLAIPAWDRFDLGARYATVLFGKPTTFRASVLNVANKSYWASTIGGYLTMGAPRTVLLSMTTDF
ncbi:MULTISPECIES: TonB-dependent siderophore receptor [unclassified Caballeronia]|uniref:TonB-dependent receptor n=1 Tax=unclassified Caballeronia TaxID=2646786 RepID=UPI001F3217A2|nr:MULTISPECIES: TonB-dependent siderophore receptor [unclassified Caballeronia]MCE4544060.1 TonB-dependent siderophore receptor [Caballeronia sp. PC1]MCE4571211.1 TonB-dependent siderophore receptor [Caballeronia sp. CLC5]